MHRSSTTDDIRSIFMSTTEILKANKRDDLCADFNNNFRHVMTEWQATHRNTSISTSTIVAGDNLIEENMDVDDDQDDKHKKQITTSSTSNSTRGFNDVDYRFLNQDMNHRKQRRKSRFSDLLPSNDDRTKKSKSNISNEKILSNEDKEKRSLELKDVSD
jgi:hypothetical protein